MESLIYDIIDTLFINFLIRLIKIMQLTHFLNDFLALINIFFCFYLLTFTAFYLSYLFGLYLSPFVLTVSVLGVYKFSILGSSTLYFYIVGWPSLYFFIKICYSFSRIRYFFLFDSGRSSSTCFLFFLDKSTDVYWIRFSSSRIKFRLWGLYTSW